MEEKFLEETLRTNVEQLIKSKVEKEIEDEVNKFKDKLENRKDQYIAEIMKGIRIYHERDTGDIGINYKIIFENIVKLEK